MEALEFWRAELPGALAVLVFALGACLGSFFNVCILRLPRGRSVVYPGSHCACGRPIAWYDNVPVLSWFLLRGRARCCGRSFSFRYPAVELATGLLFLASWELRPGPHALAGFVLISLLVPAALIDWDTLIIPDRFALGGVLAGLLLSALWPALQVAETGVWMIDAARAVAASAQGLLVGSAVILWIGIFAEKLLRREAMGFGDVKLVGAIGAFTGWPGAVFTIFAGALLGSLAHGASLLWQRRPGAPPVDPDQPCPPDPELLESYRTERLPGEIPFGPSLAAAGLLYFIFLRGPVDAYFAEMTYLLTAPW